MNNLLRNQLLTLFLSLAKCFQKIKHLEYHKLDYYIVITSRNMAKNISKKEKENLMTVSYDDDSYFVNENMSCYEFEFLKGCIKKLKVDDQEILYLKFSCGLEYSEISKTLGITSATARKRLQYAKNRLKILLERVIYNMNNFSYFSKALDEVVDARLDDYVETLEVDKRYEFSEKYNKKINKLIKHREKPYFTLICTTGRRVACFVTALLILSFSSLSVKAVREAVCNFFMNIFSDHTEIIADSEIVNSYPHSIDEEYHISSLPNGFKQVDYDKMENSIIITYFNILQG